MNLVSLFVSALHSNQPICPDHICGCTDPKSDGNIRSGLGSIGADSPRKDYGEGNDGPARQSVHDLLALVEAERNKMSKVVLSSADGLSSAVTMARKRLAANIAAVEEQLREEKRLLELARRSFIFGGSLVIR